MLIDEIKKENMQALKNKDNITRTALSIVINKYMLMNIEKKAQGKDATDEDLYVILQKAIKELQEEAENYERAGNLTSKEEILAQKQVVEKYLPKMMDREEIIAIINSLEDKTIPSVMKHFKLNYNGKVDMKMVSELARSL